MRPLIGITSADFVDDGRPYHRIYARNAWAIADAGGLPVAIPTGLAEDVLRELYERLDAVLLPGGADVDPAIYGEERHPTTYGVDDARDSLELKLARWSYADDRPLFGICRGQQLLNVAFGGTLIQDIPSAIKTDLIHDTPDELPRATIQHEVQLNPDSHLASILGSTRVAVNSLHHQSVESGASNLAVTGVSPDGIIESLEAPNKQFIISVQWHPEDLYTTDESMRHLFECFVEAACESAAHKHAVR